MQNSGRSQSPTARRQGAPADFNYAGDPGDEKAVEARERKWIVRDPHRERGSEEGEACGRARWKQVRSRPSTR